MTTPLTPPVLKKAETLAIQALATGTATDHQQRLALKVIVQDLARTHDLDWHPENQHVSSFAAGRRSVGLALLKTINAKLDTLSDG